MRRRDLIAGTAAFAASTAAANAYGVGKLGANFSRAGLLGGVAQDNAPGAVPSVGYDYFASTGATFPWYGSPIFPPAMYVAATDTDWYVWEAWTGTARQFQVKTLNHTTGKMSRPYVVGTSPLANDDHGVPSLCRDYQGYIHLFGGAHGASAFKHFTTTNPDDPSAWTAQSDVGTNAAYPHPFPIGSSIYLLYRENISASTTQPLTLQKTTALSGGVATWNTKQTIIDFGANTRFYQAASQLSSNGTDILMVATRADYLDTFRQDVYYPILNTLDDSVRNYSGSVTVANASLPINLATMNASFRLVTSNTELTYIPSFAINPNGRQHIAFVDTASGASGPYDFKYMVDNGSSWSAPITLQSSVPRDQYAGYTLVPRSDNSLDFVWSEDPTSAYTRGGSIMKMHRSPSGVWGGSSLLMAPTGSKALDVPCMVRNGHTDSRLIFTEIAASSNDADAGGLKMYAYGRRGLVKSGQRDETAALIARMSVTPTAALARAVDDLIQGMMFQGIWTLLDGFYCLRMHDAQAFRLNWKSTSYNLSEIGSGHVYTAGTSYSGGGTGYLDSGANLSTYGGQFAQNNGCSFNWTETGSGTQAWAGAHNAASFFGAWAWMSSTSAAAARLNATTSIASSPSTTGVGFAGVSRSSSTTQRSLFTSVASGEVAKTSGGVPNANFIIGGINAASLTANAGSFSGFGAALSAAQMASLRDLLSAFRSAAYA